MTSCLLMYRQTVWNFDSEERLDKDFVLRNGVNYFQVYFFRNSLQDRIIILPVVLYGCETWSLMRGRNVG